MVGRGFRAPLRDYMLADAVQPTHFGRAYGLERAADMLGAVAGPLMATLLVVAGLAFRTIILWTLVPGLLAAASIFFLARDREVTHSRPTNGVETSRRRLTLPRSFRFFLGGVFLFGLGDFARSFLIWIASRALGQGSSHVSGTVSVAVLLYTLHNLVSTLVSYPVGHLGDRTSKLRLLVLGYGLGVTSNVLLAFFLNSLTGIFAVIVLSGIYIAFEETLEKAAAAELLPRELRSFGFGVLACANAVRDRVSSLYVGYLLATKQGSWAFSIAAGVGLLGLVWMIALVRRTPTKQRAQRMWLLSRRFTG